MYATRPSSEPDAQHDPDVDLINRAARAAFPRLADDVANGRISREAGLEARAHVFGALRRCQAGLLCPADAALEILRAEMAAQDASLSVATATASSGEEWEPGDPVVLPYDPNPPVILPMDLHDTPEDWAAVRKAREARNA
ncbi:MULTISPECIES: hypothetical protein [Methylobacterium]|uniref:hypothetical protein n=1 Tax=Methylobacterium TaxID=407 RepID=UPI00272DF1A8|nr:hypothetical protein [Methylobacterium sp.]